MADFDVALKAFMSGLDTISDPTNKYLMTTDANGNVVGKMRTNAIVFQEDLVDLGLPSGLLWSKKNIGATNDTEYGLYFSWGNPQGHNNDSGSYSFDTTNYNASHGATIDYDTLLPADDAATCNLGSSWRMPTTSEFAELRNNTTWVWTTDYKGVSDLNGYVVTGTNGNSIFFPAAGDYIGASLYVRGSDGYYWASSRVSDSKAYSLYFVSGSISPQRSNGRYYGFSVRAVQ